jgi:hypothetical protein
MMAANGTERPNRRFPDGRYREIADIAGSHENVVSDRCCRKRLENFAEQ